MQKREKFNSKIGFILAATASAVGIGNLVGFPVFAAKNGGFAFLVIYIFCMLFLCLPILISEIAIGRNTRLSPYGSYIKIGGKALPWQFAGGLAVLTPFMIAVFYQVIATWVLGYFIIIVSGNLATIAEPGYFDAHLVDGINFVYMTLLFAILAVILIQGVKNGIERIATIVMPMLVLLIIGLIIFTLTQDHAWKGVSYYLTPNWNNVVGGGHTLASVSVGAMSQAFFSLSLGMGIMISYGSYTSNKYPLAKSSTNIAFVDTGFAILAGLLILPAIFVYNPSTHVAELTESSVGLMFSILPKTFLSLSSHIGYVGSSIIAALFFFSVFLAALTSQMSIMQVPIASLQDQFGWSLPKCVIVLILTMIVFIVPCLLSFGEVQFFTNFITYGGSTKSFFDFIINIFYETVLPINGFLICLLICYKWKVKNLMQEVVADPKNLTLVEKYVKLSIGSFIPLILVVIIGLTIHKIYF